MTPPLSPDIQAELAKLHDIRLPDPIGWWPLAPGWWALIVLAALGVIAALVVAVRHRRTVRYAALRELAGLKARLGDDADRPHLATDLAVLLRRVVLTGPEARRLGPLSGADWASELRRDPGGFSRSAANLIADAPYARAQPGIDLRHTMDEAEVWIRSHAR